LPKKQRVLALKSALAAKRENLVIVDSFEGAKNGKTKEFAAVLKQLKLEGQKVVVVMENAEHDTKLVQRAARNIHNVVVLQVSNLNVKDLLHADSVLVTEKGLEAINNRFKNLPQEKEESESTGKTKAKAKAKPAKKEAVAKAPSAKAKKETKAPVAKKTEKTEKPKAEKAEKDPGQEPKKPSKKAE
jgi:hypothetical protein